jgi:hypothetical protein
MLRVLAALLLAATPALAAPEIQVLHPSVPLSLGSFAFEGGKTLNLSVGIGSGAFRARIEAPGVVWTVSDRGPNIACGDVEEITGVARARLCAAARGGRVYPLPHYAPSIYRLRLDPAAGLFHVTDVIALRTQDGAPIDGLLNPLTVASTETPLDGAGRVLPQNPSAIDAEGIVRLSDGSFWLGEENGPSLVHVGPDGRIALRIVPAGTAGDYAGAGYPVIEALPAILARRATNRGIESMALSPDERTLYFIMQNPLANPDQATYQQARNTRLFAFDRIALRVVAQHVYQLDDPRSFRRDPSSRQNDPRISELTALGGGRLIVLERTEATTKLYEVDLGAGASDIAGARWDEAATTPSLERSSDLAATGIIPLTKRLLFDSADHPEVPGKIEGVAVLAPGALFLVNDDDFGITGERTRGLIVRGLDFRLGD